MGVQSIGPYRRVCGGHQQRETRALLSGPTGEPLDAFLYTVLTRRETRCSWTKTGSVAVATSVVSLPSLIATMQHILTFPIDHHKTINVVAFYTDRTTNRP